MSWLLIARPVICCTTQRSLGFYGYIQSSEYRIYYLFLGPTRRVEGYAPLKVLSGVTEDVNALQASTVPDGQIPVGFYPLKPLPDLGKDEANRPCHSKGVDIQILLAVDPPVALSPKSHAVSHRSSAVGNPGPEGGWTVENPLRQT